MNDLKKQLKKLSLKSDLINSITGIALVVSLIYIFIHPMNRYAILVACILGGLMNLLNGLKLLKDPKRKSMGMTLIMMGIIVAFLGFIIMEIL